MSNYYESGARTRVGAVAHSVHASAQCLLDLDPELADGLEDEVRAPARAAAIVRALETEAGVLPLPEWLQRASPGPGALVLDGVLVVNVSVGDRIAAELIGSGDLIQPVPSDHEELFSYDVGCRALTPSRFALLDGDFAKRVRFWPQIMQALLQRAARRAASLNVQRAIAAQPRLEIRLILLLWHLGARWGKVEPGGIRLPLPLTHQLLGRLVAAERPSVSHALGRLSAAGLVTGHGNEWHMRGDLDEHLPAMLDSIASRADSFGARAG